MNNRERSAFRQGAISVFIGCMFATIIYRELWDSWLGPLIFWFCMGMLTVLIATRIVNGIVDYPKPKRRQS